MFFFSDTNRIKKKKKDNVYIEDCRFNRKDLAY